MPVGVVRIRERHRELPQDLSHIDDALRFPVMMSDNHISGWLDCTAWLIDHPECCILIDTGESADFGSQAYFGGAADIARIYPKILDATAAPGNDLHTMIGLTGHTMSDIDVCVLTHTHCDHVGHIESLSRDTRLLVSPEELVPAARSGRLLAKLPQDGRVQKTDRTAQHDVFGSVMPLTKRGDVTVISTPGHTVGHQSVVIDLGDRQIIIAGDAAFDDTQVAQGRIPGIVENGSATLQTYDLLQRASLHKSTLTLFTHDPHNRAKLTAFAARA
jgi:glyoxylase-like metal-dependent hydrolase (beta-lactamase superfamily II)